MISDFWWTHINSRSSCPTFRVNGTSSDQLPLPVSCSVPQGSSAGPVEFIAYTEDVSEVFNRHGVQHHLYADDKQAYLHTSLRRSYSPFHNTLLYPWRPKSLPQLTQRCNQHRGRRISPLCEWLPSLLLCLPQERLCKFGQWARDSHVPEHNDLPLCQGTKVTPSGLFPSVRNSPIGCVKLRATTSLRALSLADLPGALLPSPGASIARKWFLQTASPFADHSNGHHRHLFDIVSQKKCFTLPPSILIISCLGPAVYRKTSNRSRLPLKHCQLAIYHTINFFYI